MGEHKNPRSDEQFVITENATGRRLCVRDMTDEELLRHLDTSAKDHLATMRNAMAMVGQAVNIAKMNATIAYEIERRAKAITVITDLSQIKGLRKQ